MVPMTDDEKVYLLRRRYGSRADLEPDHPKHIEYLESLDRERIDFIMGKQDGD